MKVFDIIEIHPQAPSKPNWGDPCNGCGVCCLLRPCPLGVVLSRQRLGACKALVWVDTSSRYSCGALLKTPRWPKPLIQRWIAAGQGCDCDAQMEE